MKIYSNTELKKIAKAALRNEYGFAPASTNITLLEASSDGTLIRFKVDDKEYLFESYQIVIDGKPATIWIGEGTITKLRKDGTQ